jgi:hypothetical protein
MPTRPVHGGREFRNVFSSGTCQCSHHGSRPGPAVPNKVTACRMCPSPWRPIRSLACWASSSEHWYHRIILSRQQLFVFPTGTCQNRTNDISKRTICHGITICRVSVYWYLPQHAMHFSHVYSRNARNQTALLVFALQVVLQDNLLLRHAHTQHWKS